MEGQLSLVADGDQAADDDRLVTMTEAMVLYGEGESRRVVFNRRARRMAVPRSGSRPSPRSGPPVPVYRLGDLRCVFEDTPRARELDDDGEELVTRAEAAERLGVTQKVLWGLSRRHGLAPVAHRPKPLGRGREAGLYRWCDVLAALGSRRQFCYQSGEYAPDGRPLCTGHGQPMQGKPGGAWQCDVRAREATRARAAARALQKYGDPEGWCCVVCRTPMAGIRTHRWAKYCSGTCSNRAGTFLHQYGFTPAVAWRILEAQGFTCANPGCGEPVGIFGSHVDHDHSGPDGCVTTVRGFKCSACNTSVGLLDESPQRVAGLLVDLLASPRPGVGHVGSDVTLDSIIAIFQPVLSIHQERRERALLARFTPLRVAAAESLADAA